MGCVHAPTTAPPDPLSDVIQVGCSVFDLKGVLLYTNSYTRCVFNSDGSYFGGTSKALELVGRDDQVVWSKPFHTHHILTRTANGDVLVGSSEVRAIEDEKVRSDVLLRVNRAGEIVGRFSFADHESEWHRLIWRESKYVPFTWDREALPSVIAEISHLNSYYEIPASAESNQTLAQTPAFPSGAVVINSSAPNSFLLVVTADLQSIVSMHDFGRDVPITHDVQVLPTGHLLFFNNGNTADAQPFSSLMKLDSRNWLPVWTFAENPRSRFFSKICGSVQLLSNGHVFFSDITNEVSRAREIDQNGKSVLDLTLFDHRKNPSDTKGIQEAKRINLAEFLKAHDVGPALIR